MFRVGFAGMNLPLGFIGPQKAPFKWFLPIGETRVGTHTGERGPEIPFSPCMASRFPRFQELMGTYWESIRIWELIGRGSIRIKKP